MSMGTPGRKRGSYRQAARILRLLEVLRTRRYGVAPGALADELEVTERQIRRDLVALGEAGHEVEVAPGPDGRARARLAEPGGRAVPLSLRERYALLAVRRVFDVLRDTPLWEDVASIYEKVAGGLPDEQRAELERLGDRFLFIPDGGPKGYRGKEDVLDALLTGVIRRLRVRYRYVAAAGAAKDGTLEPYAMVLYRMGLYVVGRAVLPDAPRTAPRVYAAERFADAEFLRGQSFEVPRSFRLDRYFEGAFGVHVGEGTHHVVVDFRPEARRLVEARVWHRTQKLSPLPGGGVRLELDVGNLTEVASWVLAWGPKARVRGPAELVTRVREELGAAAELYGEAGRGRGEG